LLTELPEIVTEGVGRFGKGVQDRSLLAGNFREHADGLRALTRKNECEVCCHSAFLVAVLNGTRALM
jgi:hypothetical protein